MGAPDFGGAAMTDEQVGAVGDEFARAYYTALVTDPATLRSLYGSRAKHLFLLRGRKDISARGPDDVQLFASRMGIRPVPGVCQVRGRDPGAGEPVRRVGRRPDDVPGGKRPGRPEVRPVDGGQVV